MFYFCHTTIAMYFSVLNGHFMSTQPKNN